MDGTWYLVSLVVGPTTGGSDLLVPQEHVRDLNVAVIGCREPARPQHR